MRITKSYRKNLKL